MKRRIVVGALPALAIALAARGQDAASASPAASPARSYAALSLVGDRLLIVNGGTPGGTGSMLEGRARTTSVPQPNAWLDGIAVSALKAVLPRAEAVALVDLRSSEASDFSDQEDWFSGNRLKLPDTLRKTVQDAHVQRLLLVTKHRGLARVSDGTMSEGPESGHFEGMGLYVNDRQPMQDGGRGYVAPFAFFKLSVIDAETFTVLGSRTVESAHPRSRATRLDASVVFPLLAGGILTALPKVIASIPAAG